MPRRSINKEVFTAERKNRLTDYNLGHSWNGDSEDDDSSSGAAEGNAGSSSRSCFVNAEIGPTSSKFLSRASKKLVHRLPEADAASERSTSDGDSDSEETPPLAGGS